MAFTNKILLDDNVWIRFVANGKQATLYNIFKTHGFTVICNNYLLHEIFSACVENEWYTDKEAKEIINDIRKAVKGTTERAVYGLSPDAKDNFLFDLAIQNNCLFMVSDDGNLKRMPLLPIRIETTNWFIKHHPIILKKY